MPAPSCLGTDPRASVRRVREVASCPLFGTCGGCALHKLGVSEMLAYKRALVVEALQAHGLGALASCVVSTVPAYGEGRRRITLHARAIADGAGGGKTLVTGLMRKNSHALVVLDACPILAPGLADAPRTLAAFAKSVGARLGLAEDATALPDGFDILVSETSGGLDADLRGLDLRGLGGAVVIRALVAAATEWNFARLSHHGTLLFERAPVRIAMGRFAVPVPPGAFLQPTVAGEELLCALVLRVVQESGLKRGARIADLFCGVGPFALRLCDSYAVEAFDVSPAMVGALETTLRAHNFGRGGARARDLFRQPLLPEELAPYGAVVLNPPRAGALAQARALAQSSVPHIIYVSCNPDSFARDAARLLEGGYLCQEITPVDQFVYAPHVECVAVFTKAVVRARRPQL